MALALRDDGGDDDRDAGSAPVSAPTADAPTARPEASASPEPFCSYLPAGEPARPVPSPPGNEVPDGPTTAVLRTSGGDVPIELLVEDAPCAVHSFRTLAAADFYDGTPCHRLVDRGIFTLTCGDPTGTGAGGPGYQYAEENLVEATYDRGTVAVVNSGPGTSGSQFFLVYDDSPLPAQYTPFGEISEEGLAVLDAVTAAGATPPDANGNTAPVTPVQLLDVLLVGPEAQASSTPSQ